MKDLIFSLVQYDIQWEAIDENLATLSQLLKDVPSESHIVVLPEMFATGFTMEPENVAQTMDGSIVTWMLEKAQTHKKIITGSIAIQEDGQNYNRLVWMLPNGVYYTYDKRHLFSFAGEQEHYQSGEDKLIVQVNGWKICLNICYDLRFPVWLRQSPNLDQQYDVLLFVANWPERRSHAWRTLLLARAIENQSFVVAVNRVGLDKNGIHHSGDSAIIDPLGSVLWEQTQETVVYTQTLKYEELVNIRAKFNFLEDIDSFVVL